MKYAEELSSSLNRATTTTVCAAGVLTWFFSAMQCNKEYCYTTDNPVSQVALAGTLALATVMAATSAPVAKVVAPYTGPISEKINQAKTYLKGVFRSAKTADTSPVVVKKEEETPTTTTTAAVSENINADKQATTLARTESGLFTPRSDSVQANASESSSSPHRSRSPSPTHQ